MRINADFTRPAIVRPSDGGFVPSPMAGVERLMLDRIGEEKARATSLVRYAPSSRFSEHVHAMGEEYLVLEGTFSDAGGDFGPMTYVRNPDGTRHAPWSDGGCVIFVKLRQFQPGDTSQFAVPPDQLRWRRRGEGGFDRALLHEFGDETVDYLRAGQDTALLDLEGSHGTELLVLEGALESAGQTYGTWSWLRYPPGARPGLAARPGTLLYRKTGNYAFNG